MARADAYLKEGKASEAVIEYKTRSNSRERQQGALRIGAGVRGQQAAQKAFWSCRRRCVSTAATSTRVSRSASFLLFVAPTSSSRRSRSRSGDRGRPEALEGHVIHAVALERLKRVDEAEADYKKALELQPENQNSWARSPATTCARAIATPPSRSSRSSSRWIRARRASSSTAAFWRATGRATPMPRLPTEIARAREDENRAEVVSESPVTTTGGALRRCGEDAEGRLEARKDDLDLIYALARFYNSRETRRRPTR